MQKPGEMLAEVSRRNGKTPRVRILFKSSPLLPSEREIESVTVKGNGAIARLPLSRLLSHPSHAGGQRDFEVSWHASYIRHVEGKMGAHPDGMGIRTHATILKWH